jgi:hypothetical protein
MIDCILASLAAIILVIFYLALASVFLLIWMIATPIEFVLFCGEWLIRFAKDFRIR